MREIIQSARDRMTRVYPAEVASGLFVEVPMTSSKTPPAANIAPSPRPTALMEILKELLIHRPTVAEHIKIGDSRVPFSQG